jgi:hypothetical protein
MQSRGGGDDGAGFNDGDVGLQVSRVQNNLA